MTTQVPAPVFTDDGLSTSTAQEILDGVLADWQAAFASVGKDLSLELATPQGQLAQSQAYLVFLFQQAMANLVTLVDPNQTSGVFQDALGKIYQLSRKAATFATVDVQAVCSPWVTIPAGIPALSDTDGSTWSLASAVNTGSGGTVTMTFVADTAGAGPVVGINALRLTGSATGLESITNAAASVAGTNVEGRAAFELRRQASVAIGSKGTPQAVRSALASLDNVTDVYVYNNPTGAEVAVGSTAYPVPAHSLAVVVAGGDAQEIAETMFYQIDAGCGMVTSDATEVTVYDSDGYAEPYPSYVMAFLRPVSTPVYFYLQVAESDQLPANYIGVARASILSTFTEGYAQGSLVIDKARVGAYLVAADYLPALRAIDGLRPVSITVSLDNVTFSGIVELGIDQLPTTDSAYISVEVVSA